MKWTKVILITFLLVVGENMEAGNAFTEDVLCNAKNITTQPGEKIDYIVYYSVAGVYVNAGNASFLNTLEKLNGRTVYHITADGKTNASYDWIYKVRDIYETYMDTATLEPIKFVRNINEGGFKNFESITFNHSANTVVTSKGVYKVPDCIEDVLSAVYNARNINFANYKKGDKIPFKMFLDNEVYEMYIRYLGKEDIKTKYGKFRAIKFKPLLVKGTIFEGGEKMTVWISDDQNHIPLRVESPIIIGTVKVDMMSYKNIRYPLSSLKNIN